MARSGGAASQLSDFSSALTARAAPVGRGRNAARDTAAPGALLWPGQTVVLKLPNARGDAALDGDRPRIGVGGAPARVVLLGHAQPFGEPVVSAGPFVMNTEAEIQQAYRDYQRGAFGSWNG